MSTLTYSRRQVQYSGDSEAIGYDSKVVVVHGYENKVIVRQQD